MNLPLAVGAAEKLQRLCKELKISQAKLVECLLCLNDSDIALIVQEKLPEVNAMRTNRRKSRLKDKRTRVQDMATRLKSMSSQDLDRLEGLMNNDQKDGTSPG